MGRASGATDAVSELALWREHINKLEKTSAPANREFKASDSRKLRTLSQKPSSAAPYSVDESDLNESIAELKQFCSSVNTQESPQARYSEPQTTNQEVGWQYTPVHRSSGLFTFPRVSSDETSCASDCSVLLFAIAHKAMCATNRRVLLLNSNCCRYAASYTSMTGASPFKQRQQ